jgi:hypothetical protein
MANSFSISSGALASIQLMLLSLSQYISTNITVSNVSTQQSTLEAIKQTLWNALNIVDAYSIQTFMQQEYSLISRILTANLGLSPTDQAFVTNRVNSFNSLVLNVYPLSTWLTYDITKLSYGEAAIPYYDLLGYFASFNAEIIPSALTLDNFDTQALACANAWNNVLIYLNSNGTTFQVSAYNSVDRMTQSCYDLANVIDNLVFANGVNVNTAWNTLVALPTLLRVAAILNNDPSNQTAQTTNAVKFLIIYMLYQINAVLAVLSEANNVTLPQTSQLRSGETLMDFAARTTGDFSNWQNIAQLNNLLPPYISNTTGPNVATPGQYLYITGTSSTGETLTNYLRSYLGTDIDLGKLFSTLTNWNGDFATSSGFTNFTNALARRVLTELGTLIYHSDYGSQLIEQVGNIRSANSATLLAGYLRTALMSDPRTQSVGTISAVPYSDDQIVLGTNVTPVGTSNPQNFNLVIVPVPGNGSTSV